MAASPGPSVHAGGRPECREKKGMCEVNLARKPALELEVCCSTLQAQAIGRGLDFWASQHTARPAARIQGVSGSHRSRSASSRVQSPPTNLSRAWGAFLSEF